MHPISDSGGASVPAFLAKLWRLVEDPKTNHLIYWNSDGRSFIIQNQAQFAREQLPLNYKHNNMASFIRQLNMYGFHKITSLDNGGLKFDRDEMEFSHPCFQRGHPFMLENIKRKIAHARNQPEEKSEASALTQVPAVKQETLSRVLNEVKMMRGKQDVLNNRFSSMKQENEALWREVVMLRQKHMKQQQIVNKLIQFLVTIVQPSGRGNMGMKRRLPLMLNEPPTASKSRKMSGSDYGLEISSMVNTDDEDDEDNAYLNLMSGDSPIVLQTKMGRPATSTRGMISELPNTPSSTRSHHDDLEDIDVIIEEEAPEADVNRIFEELNEATTTTTTAGEEGPRKRSKKTVTAAGAAPNGRAAAAAANSVPQQPQVVTTTTTTTTNNDDNGIEMGEFLKFNSGNALAGPSSDQVAADGGAVSVQPVEKTWYANKDGFVSEQIPIDLFDDQSQHSVGGGVQGLQDRNVNPTLSEDLATRIDEADAAEKAADGKKAKKFNGKHLQLARLPSNSGDVFSLNTPEDFTLHLDSVQSDLNALKGILASDTLVYDPNQLAGPGTGGSSPGALMNLNANALMSLVDNDYTPKMFDDDNVLIPYQLSGDCLGDVAVAGASAQGDNVGNSKQATDKQMLQYNPTLDFSELLAAGMDDEGSSSSLAAGQDFLATVDGNGNLDTPQPQ